MHLCVVFGLTMWASLRPPVHPQLAASPHAADEMGKPAVNDLRSGLATAPTLYAAEEFPELLPLIQRRFKEVRVRGVGVRAVCGTPACPGLMRAVYASAACCPWLGACRVW